MALKSALPAAKQATILAWFRNSRVAHSIKDLEKALPSIASINGLQVKDYLQALADENKIHVEKIGSGNWYWSFANEEKRSKERVLSKVTEERDKFFGIVLDLQQKINEAGAARVDDDDMLLEAGNDRKSLTRKHRELAAEVDALKQEVVGYHDNDPAEVERKRLQVDHYKRDAETWTEHIQSMEGWFKAQTGGDREQLAGIKRIYYRDQFDEEGQCLREL